MTRVLILLSFLLAACTDDRAADAGDSGITIMAFNVENLFDNVDDPRRDDKAYLPLAAKQNDAHRASCNTIEVDRWRDECLHLDWNDAVVEDKLAAVAAAIRQVDGGPDIIALQEVENASILGRLRDEQLADLGYQTLVLIEGQDSRGIDVAFLSKLPLAGDAVLHPISFDDFPEREGDTRGILEATFELPDGGRLTGYSVHFPAPFHPTEMREAAYRRLNELLNALPDDRPAFAAGDFNTTAAEIAETGILDRLVRPYWQVTPDDCRGDCRGTNYYARGDSWSFLDMILWSPTRGENATWGVRAESIIVANAHPRQRRPDGTPKRYSARDRDGVSDHWPLIMTIERAANQ